MMLEPFRSTLPAIRRLRDEMDRLFGGMLEGRWDWDGEWAGFLGAGVFPAMNVWETDQAVVAEVEVPGVAQSDLDVQVVGNELTIRGERKEDHLKDSVYHRRERPAAKFTRTIELPVPVDESKVEASLKDGVLTVTLPKAEAAKPRRIAIRGS